MVTGPGCSSSCLVLSRVVPILVLSAAWFCLRFSAVPSPFSCPRLSAGLLVDPGSGLDLSPGPGRVCF